VLRILGAPRRHLFRLVAAEVAAVGAVGIGLGVLVGQAINNLVIVPFIAEQAAGLGAEIPLVSLSAVLIAVAVSVTVLAISALAPARRAAGTKVTHAINPGVADGIGLDDLAKMRERRTDLRISGAGLVVLFYPLLIFFAFPLAFDFGILWIMAALIFGALMALIVGAAMVFFLVILPMERGLLAVLDGVAARTGYFVRRTVLRGKARNTLISLMIVVSATLPTFLATSFALEVANTATDRRLQGGAPFRIRPPAEETDGPIAISFGEGGPRGRFEPELLDEVRADPGFGATLALSAPYRAQARDGVGLREVSVSAVGVDGDLREVLYPEAIEMQAGGPEALARLATEPGTAVIGAGLATFFDRGVGDTLLLEGAGRDHDETVTIVGVAGRLGGVGVFSAKQTRVQSGESTVVLGLPDYRRLTSDPQLGPPDPNERVVGTLLAQPVPGVDEADLTADLRLTYATAHDLAVDSTAETVRTVQEESRTGQLFLIVLTALTSVLAVFGVFAVIYVSIYGRRGEIGMLKAIGSPGRHLLRVFVGEAMVMTLAATLTGVTAGVVLAYALRVSESFQREVPTILAFDRVVVPAMLLLMILSSFVSAVVATHNFRRMRAIEILRTL
jgi:ABC-type antimicrobial peptide transport system permease subunit